MPYGEYGNQQRGDARYWDPRYYGQAGGEWVPWAPEEGADWWDTGDPTNYEQILNNLMQRFQGDPSPTLSSIDPYLNLYTAIPNIRTELPKQLWEMFSGKGGARSVSPGGQGLPPTPPQTQGGFQGKMAGLEGLMGLMRTGTEIGGRQQQAALEAAGLGQREWQGALGGLSGFRGQDMQRYMQEMQMEQQLKMLMAQIGAQSQDGGIWEILSGLTGLIPGLGGLFGGGGGGGYEWD